MIRGVVFDIKDFAVSDGDGVRTTVFFKGCPLRCRWCHNPEGLSPLPELYIKGSCTDCGLCKGGCDHPDCRPYGRCLQICPRNAVTVAGREYTPEELASRLKRDADMLNAMDGGITFSGGEPLMRVDFLVATAAVLRPELHLTLETSGYAPGEDFGRAITLFDEVLMDLKLADPALHREYTGRDNALILANSRALKGSGISHRFRIPLIPGVTATRANLTALASVAGDSRVELLPYNALAGAKYRGVGREFAFSPSEGAEYCTDTSIFKRAMLR